MMRLPLILPLFFFVCLSGAENGNSGWKMGNQYTYKVQGRTLTGIHQVKNQYAGVLLRAKVTIDVIGENQLSLQVKDAEYADVNRYLVEGWVTYIPEEEVEYKRLALQSSACQVYLQKGVVQRMVVEESLPTWELNFLKAIASQFQVDTQAVNLKKSIWNNVPNGEQQNGVFTTKEGSVHGISETLYQINPMPEYLVQSSPGLVPLPHLQGDGQVYNIEKSRNFTNSNYRDVYSYGMDSHGGWSAGSNNLGDLLQRTSGSRIVITGDLKKYTIQYTETTEKIVVAPSMSDKRKGIAISYLNVSLESVIPSSGQPPLITSPRTVNSLAYEYHRNHHTRNSAEGSGEESGSSHSASDEKKMESFKDSKTSYSAEWIWTNYDVKNSTEMKLISNTDENDSSTSSSSSHEDSSISSHEEYPPSHTNINESPFNAFSIHYLFGQESHAEQTVEKIIKLSSKIGHSIINPKNIFSDHLLSYFSILSGVVTAANSQQLRQAVEKIYYPKVSDVEYNRTETQNYYSWVALRDALSIAGTGPALVTLNSMIKEGKLQGEEAAALLAMLPTNAAYPTTEYMNYFFEMVKSDEVQSQRYLNTSAIFAFSELVRKGQVDRATSKHRYPIHLWSAKHRAEVTEKYIPYFKDRLTSAMAAGDSVKAQVYIRSLGNFAHPRILAVFEPYLEGKLPASDYQRFLMVDSLNIMVRVHPDTARPVLYRIYQNEGENSFVRVAAVVQLMKAKPSPQLLQHMAMRTNYDHSKHVNAAIKSSILTAVKGDYEADPELITAARSAINFLTTENYGTQHCRNILRAYIDKHRSNMHYRSNVAYIHGPGDRISSAILYSIQKKINGIIHEPEVNQYHLSSSQDLYNLLWSQLQEWKNHQSNSNETTNGSDFTYQKIHEALNAKYETQKQVEGSLVITLSGAIRYFTFDSHTIEQLPDFLRQISRKLQEGINFEHGKFFNQETVELRFPTAMGGLFSYSYRTPSFRHLQVKGKGHFEQNKPTGYNMFPFNAGINGKYHYLETNQRRSMIAFTFGQQRYVAGLERIAQVNLPLEGELSISGKNSAIKVSLKPRSVDNEEQNHFQYRENVYTSYQDVDDLTPILGGPHVKLVESAPSKSYNETFGKEHTGQYIQVEIRNERNLKDIYSVFKDLKYMPTDILNMMSQLDESMGNKYYNISYVAPNSATIILAYNTTSEMSEPGQINSKNLSHRSMRRRLKNHDESNNMDQPSAVNNRMEALLRNANSGVQNGKAYVLDASVSFDENPNKGQYSLTVAHAESPVSELSRYLVYYRGIPIQESRNAQANQLELQLNIKKPVLSTLNYNHSINMKPASTVEAKINFGKGKESEILIKGTAERTEERRNFVEKDPMSVLCKEQMEQGQFWQYPCQNASLAASYSDKYQLSVKYNNIPQFVNRVANKIHSIGRYFAYEYNTENAFDAKNPKGQVNVAAKFSEDFQFLNVSIEGPSISSHFKDIELNDITVPFVPWLIYEEKQIINRIARGVCTMDAATVTTFSNRTYPLEMSNCYHVLTTYFPKLEQGSQHVDQEHYKKSDYNTKYFAILAKEIDSNKKVIKVVLGENVVTLEPSDNDGISVNSNGESIGISEGTITRWKAGQQYLEAYIQPGNKYVVLHFLNHGTKVYYDGHRAQLIIPNRYLNRVRGLCGTFDGEPVNDFTTTNNCVLRDYKQFTASYAISDGQCTMPETTSQENASCYTKGVKLVDVVSDSEAGRGSSKEEVHAYNNTIKPLIKNPQGCTNHKVLIDYFEGMTCFSIKPQVACQPNCKPQGQIEKTIQFHCLNESSATRHWVAKVKKGANPDFSQKKSNRQMSVKLPEKCVPNP
uniref:Vitellogenin-2 n=1 Tax=Eurygaster maura TaxID=1191085 RepID=A0A8F4K3M8_9HEMI|nr:vitellogenin-2 [Eurygaster maura]